MSVNVVLLNRFKRDIKRLGKKFRSLLDDIDLLIDSLEKQPDQGKSLGAGLYKIRLASQSKGKGKRGGFRVITYYIEKIGEEEIVYLVTLYDKSEEEAIQKAELLNLVEKAFEFE